MRNMEREEVFLHPGGFSSYFSLGPVEAAYWVQLEQQASN